jgi:hypothetical protein
VLTAGSARAARGRGRPGGLGAGRAIPRGAAWLLFCLLALLAGVYLMVKADGNTFFYDDWTWLATRRSGLHAILAAYNDHMLIGATALYQWLFHTVGLRSYWVFRLFGTAAHLILAAVAFAYGRRRLGAPALLLVLPFLVLGSGWEYVIWPINVGFVGSIALSTGALLVLDGPQRSLRRDATALGLLVLALLGSEFTVLFAAGLAVELTLRDRSLQRAWIWAIPLALYALWWLGYHEPAAATRLDATPGFAAALAAAATGDLLGLDINWGRPLFVALLALLAWRWSRSPALNPRLAGLIVTAGAFWLLVALGRASGGDPTAPRYAYTGALLLILILAELLPCAPWRPSALVAGGVLASFAVGGNLYDLTQGEDGLRVASQTARAELGALQIARRFVPPTLPIDPHYMPGLTAGEMLAAFDQLHSDPGDAPSAIPGEGGSAAAAADHLLVVGGALRLTASAAGALSGSAGGARSPGGAVPALEAATNGALTRHGPCIALRSRGSGASLDVRLPAAGLRLRAAPGPGVAVYARRFAGRFGVAPAIGSIAGGGTLIVTPRPDGVNRPWSLRLSPHQLVTACTVP